eukprot:1626373-Rhodomonas_salina.1
MEGAFLLPEPASRNSADSGRNSPDQYQSTRGFWCFQSRFVRVGCERKGRRVPGVLEEGEGVEGVRRVLLR